MKKNLSALSAPVLPAVSVAAFASDKEQAAALLRGDTVRAETLRRCYAIPGYEGLPLAEKNALYDRVRFSVSVNSAPTLTHPDMRFLREEGGEDFLREMSHYYGFTIDGYETGEYFADIESAFDAAELFQQRGNMNKRIEIVRYTVSGNN